jgi:hypothetical protein
MATTPNNRDAVAFQITSTTQTPPYVDGLFGTGVGPWSWISVYGEPGTAMTASVTSLDVRFVESGRNIHDFMIPSSGRAEFRAAYYMKSGALYEPLHAPTERLAVQCTVQGKSDPSYGGNTNLIFASYVPVNSEIFSYAVSSGAPGNSRDSGLMACDSIYVVVTPAIGNVYQHVYVEFTNTSDAYIPGSPDGQVRLTAPTDTDPNQYAMINVRYPNNKRQVVQTTVSLPESSSSPYVNVPISFIEFPATPASDSPES